MRGRRFLLREKNFAAKVYKFEITAINRV